MLKAILDLNDRKYRFYKHIDLERNWNAVTEICIWLKMRNFDLTMPIFVIKNTRANTLTFFQTATSSGEPAFLPYPKLDRKENNAVQ